MISIKLILCHNLCYDLYFNIKLYIIFIDIHVTISTKVSIIFTL